MCRDVAVCLELRSTFIVVVGCPCELVWARPKQIGGLAVSSSAASAVCCCGCITVLWGQQTFQLQLGRVLVVDEWRQWAGNLAAPFDLVVDVNRGSCKDAMFGDDDQGVRLGEWGKDRQKKSLDNENLYEWMGRLKVDDTGGHWMDGCEMMAMQYGSSV